MKTIVVQETDNDIRGILAMVLQIDGFEVIPLKNCDDNLIDLVDKLQPNAVILNYESNEVQCIQMCKRLKERNLQLPIIALSFNANINTEYLRYGFDAYIEKPFDMYILSGILKKHATENRLV